MDRASAKPSCILVVDDDARNRALLRAHLQDHHEVVEAVDGRSAIALVEQRPVDLVLLDVMMPGMSGFDVCREIKRRAGESFLPVLLLTALSEQEDRNEGLGAGADDFLTKPVNRRELLLRVEAFLRTRTQDALIRRQVQDLAHLAALKDDLISLVVHDLRNPLAALLVLLRSIRSEITDPELRRDLEAALSAAERVGAMVEDLLEVRLVEEGRVPAHREPHSAAEIARGAIGTLESLAAERDISVMLSVEGDPVERFDPRLVRRAVENLLANAIRYSNAGGRVEVAVRRAGGWLEIEVADRGPGVSDAVRGALFEKFGTAAAARNQRRGYGLGLYLVRLVAEVHGGTASVHDREGGGAAFRMRMGESPIAV